MPGRDVVPTSPARDLAPAAAGPEVERLAAAAADYAEASSSTSTRRAYHSAWARFTTWCDAHAAIALPAHPNVLILYLTESADQLAVSTLMVHLAAVDHHHFRAGHAKPRSPELKQVWDGIRRAKGRPPRKKRALVTKDLQLLVKALPPGISGLRDKAVLLLGYASAMRRSEIAALELDTGQWVRGANQLRFVAGGAEINIGQSKTDQLGDGQKIGVPNGKTKLCPIGALRAWLEAAGIVDGAVFRPIDRHGRVGSAALSDRGVAEIVKRACERVGLDPDLFGGHSLRSGFVTQAAANDVPLERIMRTSRHRKPETVLGYIRDADLLKRSAGRSLGL